MKHVLEQLLRAEEAGRRVAARREAEGERLVAEAETQSVQIAERARDTLAQQIEAIGVEVRAATDAALRVVAGERERAIGRCRAQAEERRPEALRQLLKILLDEPPAEAGQDDRPAGPTPH